MRRWWEKLLLLLPVMDVDASRQRFLARSAVGVMSLQALQLILSFGTSLMLARWLGPDGFGEYKYLLSWVFIFGAFSSMGADELVLKEYPMYENRKLHAHKRGLIVASFIWTLGAALFMAFVLWVCIESRIYPTLTKYADAALMLVVAVPLVSLIAYFSATLQVKQRLLHSQWPNRLGRPLLFALLIGAAWLCEIEASSKLALALWTAVAVCVTIYMLIPFLRLYAPIFRSIRSHSYAYSRWSAQLFLFFLLPLLDVIYNRVDNLLIMHLLDARSVGLYAVAARLSELVALPMIVFQIVFAAQYARYHTLEDKKGLQQLLQGGAKLTLIAGIPICLILICCGDWILSLYGTSFTAAYGPLIALSAAQLVFIAIGALSTLLLMTGYAKQVLYVLGLGLLANVLAHLVLVPMLGIMGAVWARSIVYLFMQIAYVYLVCRHLGVWPMAWGGVKR